MAAGTTIEKLFLSLGLDMSQLDSDFLTADKTVDQNMKDIKTKTQQAKIKMDIDMTQFKGAENSAEALAVKTKHLTEQMELQKRAVLLTSAAYKEAIANENLDDAVKQRLLTRLLREQKAEADLAAQIRQTNTARAGGNTGNTGVNTAGTLSQIGDAGRMAGMHIQNLHAKMLAMTAVAASGAGLFELVKGAVEAGDATYKLSTRLNLTTDEARSLNQMLKLSDVDSQAFISTMIKMDKQVQTAGKDGNALTDSMKVFDFSLKGANGSLLPMNQQLEQLAKGYKNAATAGEEEAFVSEVLGAKGAALVPMLKDYAENAEAASKVKSIGIDPQQAHELAVEFKVLNMETKQMENALGMALMPVAKELLPGVISGFTSMVGAIKDNKEGIVDTSKLVVELIGDVKTLGAAALAIPKFALDLAGIHSAKDALRDYKVEMRELKNHYPLDKFTNDFLNSIPGLKGHVADFRAEASSQLDAEDKFTAEQNKEIAKRNTMKKAMSDIDKSITEQKANDELAARKKEIDSAKANAKAKIELADEVYKSTHTAYENELHDVDNKKQKLIDDGVSEETATEITEARKKIIIDKNDKEILKLSTELNDAIYKSNHTALENRLHDIETERKAWIEKTHDEVNATQNAEQEKRKAINDAIYGKFAGEIRAVADAKAKGINVDDAYKAEHKKRIDNENNDDFAKNYVRKLAGDHRAGDIDRSTYTDGNSAGNRFNVRKEDSFDMSQFNSTDDKKKSGNINLNNKYAVEISGFTAEQVTNAVTKAKEEVGITIYHALQDAKNQMEVG